MRLNRLSVFLSAAAMLIATVVADAQPSAASLAGQWQGSYTPKAARQPGSTRSKQLGGDTRRGTVKLPVMVTINVGADGKPMATWTGTAQQGTTPAEITMEGDTIRLTMPATKASWEGKLSADGSKLEGKWEGKGFGGEQSAPLVLRRVQQ
jgi:hypothetical protein